MKDRNRFNPAWVLTPCFILTILLGGAGCAPPQAKAAVFKCGDALGCITVAPGAPLKFGALFTLTGGSSPGGMEQLHTVQLTMAERGNKLLGHPIDLHVEDELCTPEGGANGALRIVADPQVVAIFGTNCSSAAVTAGKIMSEKGMVMISAANTSPTLTGIGDKAGANWVAGYYRTAWNDSVMGKAAAIFAYQKLHLAKAAVVNAGDAYTKGLTDAFSASYNSLGGRVVLDSTTNEDEGNDTPLLDAVAQSGADLLFFPFSHPEAGSRLVRQARGRKDFDPITLIGGEGMLSAVFIKGVGEAGKGVYIPGPTAPAGADNAKLEEKYKAMFGLPPASFYYALTYDAVNLVLDTLPKVSQQEPDGTLHIGRQALRAALYATSDYHGLTGTLKCDNFGDCGVAHLNIMRLDDPAAGVEGLKANVIFSYDSK